MTAVINPFQGKTVMLDWAGHKALGLSGGTDYKVDPGINVIAAMTGMARALGPTELNAVSITAPNGLVVSVRELRSQTGHYPRQVVQGEVIGVTGLIRPPLAGGRWPHIDANRPSDGQRVPFEQYLGTLTSTGETHLTGDDDMITRRFGQVTGHPAIYYIVNGLVVPMIDGAALTGNQEDVIGLWKAGDPFLTHAAGGAWDGTAASETSARNTLLHIYQVDDVRRLGVLPLTTDDFPHFPQPTIPAPVVTLPDFTFTGTATPTTE